MPCFYSIIIPTYNSSGTIKRAVESVLNQSFKNYEILIIDALSQDNTINIVKEYTEGSNRIKWTSEKDNGVYDAMNKGIKIAKGEWIYFLGSDDYLFNNDVLAKVNDAIAGSIEVYDFIYGNVFSPTYGEKYDGEFDRNKLLKKNICHQAIFYNKSIFEEKGTYNLKYKVLADYEFNLRCLLDKNIRTKYINLIIAYYSEGGVSSRIEDKAWGSDFNNVVKKHGFKSLPLKKLKSYCNSNLEFLGLLKKRWFCS